MGWNYALMKGKTIFVRVFLFRHPFMTNPTILWTLLHSNEYESFNILWFSCKEKVEISSMKALANFRDIPPARTFWNYTHCLLSPFTLDWSRNLLHYPMWNMTDNNISYPTYPFSRRIEKSYTIKIIPFFCCLVYSWMSTSIFFKYDNSHSKLKVCLFQTLRESGGRGGG